MKILLTGGAGYIGSHICVELIRAGYSPVIFDNFSNSHPKVPERIGRITGVVPTVISGDIRDRDSLSKALASCSFDAVIHLAGRKSVAESVREPAAYHATNVAGTETLIDAMQVAGVHRLVFASSCTVYGEPLHLPIREDHALSPFSPYGETKLATERILEASSARSASFRVAILRFFNPVGAHESGLIGEDPKGVPENLMPYLTQVAVGRRPHLNVFGKDYETPDGTCVRDYVHVMDIAAGHLKALQGLERQRLIKVNLGTGRGHSVLELVDAFSRSSGKDIALRFAPRRSGDVARCYASAALASETIGWRAERSLGDMCADAWRWQHNNPNGYQDA